MWPPVLRERVWQSWIASIEDVSTTSFSCVVHIILQQLSMGTKSDSQFRRLGSRHVVTAAVILRREFSETAAGPAAAAATKAVMTAMTFILAENTLNLLVILQVLSIETSWDAS